MAFLIVCAALTCMIQLAVLFGTERCHDKLRFLSIILLELIPLGGTVYYAVWQPPSGLLGCEFRSAMCLWIVGAVLLGYAAAWIIYAWKKK